MLSVHSVANQVLVLQVTVVVLLVVGAAISLVVQTQSDNERGALHRSVTAAQTFANSPGIVAALRSEDPTAVLQPRAEAARKAAGGEFIIVMSTEGVRYTHPFQDRIGKKFVGNIGPALEGKVVVETVGDQQQVIVPVTDDKGSVVGLVSTGFTIERVTGLQGHQLPPLLLGAGAGLVLATVGTALVSRRLRRQTRGLGPVEMTRMYEHHDAVLHSVREGVLITGSDGRLLLANDEARRLLDLPAQAEGRHVTDLGLEAGAAELLAAELLASGRVATDEVHLAGDRLLAVNVRPVDQHGSPAGSVATLRDTTELRALAGRAEGARERLRLLYEAGVRIGTTLEVVRTAEELAEVAVPRFADFVTVELLAPVLRGEEPTGASTEMCRAAMRGIREDPPLYHSGEPIRLISADPLDAGVADGHSVLQSDLAASDDWRAQDPEQAQRAVDYGIHSLISVPLRARGVVLGVANFWRSDHPPFEQDDLSLAEELAARAAGAIDNARRYTRERTLAVTLQRSLLPRALPEQSAVEVAHRYLPAQAGAGGDWFDVIPLPSARVALVVGDVVGHGLHAAATMGRLRTAVHNFSTLDLPPDELLAHLDELVARIDADEAAEGGSEGISGATCLFAIYDPVAGVCTFARAGHPGPALVRPDGTVTFPEVPASPPLGVGGGLPFETAELQLPEGSSLVLYTDGLVENGHRDHDTGLDLLRDALAHPDRSPEQHCQAVFDALRPARPTDDIALLIARTRLLDPGRVAEWDIPAEPAAVSQVRTDVSRRLEDWDLDQVIFTTELVVSELVTNAIRYGTPPIRLRLLHDRNHVICEVTDGSSTSPHLRRAATTDEGGRGLFLITQYTQRWGTRYMARGKVIWTEQTLIDGAAEPGELTGDILLDQWDDIEP
ncbi:SpoIIE family protein phosphatase [Streptomyces sp. NPDC058534]|uniref:SpoIIE family protein phosphatase n=1 Tax=Streptomyces sp. NPDC058534 TaxID=3346541 RepID=UPI0036467F0E